MWRREGQPSRLLIFLNKQPQHVLLFQLCFFLFSSVSCYLPSFSLSLSFSCTHTYSTVISGIPFAPRLVWCWKGARRKHAVQSKRIHDVILTSTKLLVQRLSLNINGNWSDIPEFNERNYITGAQMDKLKTGTHNIFRNCYFIDLWCAVHFGAPALS